jgi:hypothetical protein
LQITITKLCFYFQRVFAVTWALSCWHAFVAGQENPVLPLPYAETTITPSTTEKDDPTFLRTTSESQLTTSQPVSGQPNEANRSTSGPTEPTTTNPFSEPPDAVGPRQQNSSVTEGPALKTSVQEPDTGVNNTQTIPASSGTEVTQERKRELAVTDGEFRNSDPISAVQETQNGSTTHNYITTYSTTTEIPELPTTTTGPRSRDLTEDTTASILSDVELTTYSTTTKIPELPTTTTTGPRSRDLTDDTTATILSDVE